jgi:hypothetical protein
MGRLAPEETTMTMTNRMKFWTVVMGLALGPSLAVTAWHATNAACACGAACPCGDACPCGM